MNQAVTDDLGFLSEAVGMTPWTYPVGRQLALCWLNVLLPDWGLYNSALMIASQVQAGVGELKLPKGRIKTTILAELLEYAAGMSQQSSFLAEPGGKVF